MTSGVVIAVEPGWERFGALFVGGEHLPVGPFDLEGPVEPFDFPVLPWTVRPDRDVVCADVLKSRRERPAIDI